MDVVGVILDHHLHAVAGTEAVVIAGVVVTADPDHLQRESAALITRRDDLGVPGIANLPHHHQKEDSIAPHLMKGARVKEAHHPHGTIDQ